MGNTESLIKCLEPVKLRLDEPMSAHTTLGVGGKADLFYTTENSGDLVKAVRLCRTFGVAVTVIGGGGGVVVSDSGIRGMVIRNKSERIQIKPQRNLIDLFRRKEIKKAEVVIDSGVDSDVAVDKLESLGIVGLEETGPIRMSVLDLHGGVRSIGVDKKIGENILIDKTYVLSYGEITKLRKKTVFPKSNSVIGVFEDILKDEQMTLGYPTCDVGYIVGEVLNMKGFQSGKMTISDLDQNVIVNLGGGKASDFIVVMEEIKRRARETIGIELEEKVVRLGFEVR